MVKSVDYGARGPGQVFSPKSFQMPLFRKNLKTRQSKTDRCEGIHVVIKSALAVLPGGVSRLKPAHVGII